MENKQYHIYAYSTLNYDYDDRTFKKLYKPLENDFNVEMWANMQIEPNSAVARSFLRDRENSEKNVKK